MVFERAGVQVGSGHLTAVEYDGRIKVIAHDGTSGASAYISAEDARHMAMLLRRLARRVDRQ